MTQQELVLSAEFFLRILTAAVCGIVIGYERENRNKEAGIQMCIRDRAREMLDKFGNPPLVTLDQVEELLNTAQKEGCLTAEQLEYIGITLTAVERLKDYLSRGKHLESGLPFYEADLYPMTVSYTHLDVYKRQHLYYGTDRSGGWWDG